MLEELLKRNRKLKGFTDHGVVFKSIVGTQVVGTCPFCGKDKFHCHQDDLVWDCKVCGKYGNFSKFLEYRAGEYVRDFGKHADALVRDRELRKSTFVAWDVE